MILCIPADFESWACRNAASEQENHAINYRCLPLINLLLEPLNLASGQSESSDPFIFHLNICRGFVSVPSRIHLRRCTKNAFEAVIAWHRGHDTLPIFFVFII